VSDSTAASERRDDDEHSDEPLYGEWILKSDYILFSILPIFSLGTHVQYVHDDDENSENDVQFMGDIFVKNCIFIN